MRISARRLLPLLLPLLALLLPAAARAAQANEAALEALCAKGGGTMKRVGISGVQRLDCGSDKTSWFQVRSPNGNIVGHYVATRGTAWRPAIEAAIEDLAVLCGDLPPQLQFEHHKLIADCGSDLK